MNDWAEPRPNPRRPPATSPIEEYVRLEFPHESLAAVLGPRGPLARGRRERPSRPNGR